jgi:NAD(P)-dependent dehydrogenase (short-subunit alcohol dehydrogenase family)
MPTVLITGANRGLGFEFANQYAAEGWRVIASCRNPAGAISLRKLAPTARDMLSVISMDVTDNDSVRKRCIDAHGCHCRRADQQRRDYRVLGTKHRPS